VEYEDGFLSTTVLKKENLIPEQQATHQPSMKQKTLDIGELWARATISKIVLGGLALLTLSDSLLVSRTATPGHGATFILGWALVTRLWLIEPSSRLLSFCLVDSIACACANHGHFTSVGILHSFYFYIFTSLLIVYWERFTGYLGFTDK
jgi:hypothetical protein